MTNGQRRERGELEAHVLRVLWDSAEPLTAKDIRARIPGVTPAHTTVLTALDRLLGKGEVVRASERSRDIAFAPARTEDEHVSLAMLQRLGSSSDREAALMRFAGALDADDIDALRRAMRGRSDGAS